MNFKILKLKSKQKKILVICLNLFTLGIFLYLLLAPLYPALKYYFFLKPKVESQDYKSMAARQQNIRQPGAHLPETEYAVSPNRLIIPKIGVNAPIVEARKAEWGLNRGAWHLPNTSTPDKGGNMVISGHRFKYLPPNNTTFYLFDKLKIGDEILVIWQKKEYYYKIKKIKIVDKYDQSILKPTVDTTLTLFTCHPLYSQDKRLVVIAKPE